MEILDPHSGKLVPLPGYLHATTTRNSTDAGRSPLAEPGLNLLAIDPLPSTAKTMVGKGLDIPPFTNRRPVR